MHKAIKIILSKKNLAVTFTSIVLMNFSVQGFAQSLDDAVADQLRTIEGNPCDILLGLSTTDPESFTVLEAGLRDICKREAGTASTNPANSTGGGAGTPTMLPSVVKQRLENEESKEEDESTWSFGQWSTFISGEYETIDRDVTTFEDGYESDLWRLTVGADVKLTERLLVGAAVIGSDQNGDFDGGGDFSVDSSGIIAYGSYNPIERAYLQVSGGYSSKSNDRVRIAFFESFDDPYYWVAGSPDADYDVKEYSAGLLAGYDFAANNLTYGPMIGLDWVRTEFDGYSETGDSGLELTFYETDVTSLQSTLGVQGSAAFSTSYGVVSAQLGLAWKHEFENDQREEVVSFVHDTRHKQFTYQTEKPERYFTELTAGLLFVLPHNIQMFGNYRTLLGHSFIDDQVASIGLRVDF